MFSNYNVLNLDIGKVHPLYILKSSLYIDLLVLLGNHILSTRLLFWEIYRGGLFFGNNQLIHCLNLEWEKKVVRVIRICHE